MDFWRKASCSAHCVYLSVQLTSCTKTFDVVWLFGSVYVSYHLPVLECYDSCVKRSEKVFSLWSSLKHCEKKGLLFQVLIIVCILYF